MGEELVTVTTPLRDEGTIVLFGGIDEDGNNVVFAADHRPAQAIVDALGTGEDVVASVPTWAFVG